MNKVLVIGSGGAGKSRLSIELGAALGLPVIHLDRLHWSPGWVEPDKKVWRETVRELIASEQWVMDGNYGGTLDLRVPAADTIIYLDFPPLTCLWRVIKRRVRNRDRSRPDMASGCPEHLDLDFLRWIWSFRKERRPKIMKLLEEHGSGKNLIILTGPGQAETFLGEVSGGRRYAP